MQKNLHILYVEDDLTNQTIIQMMLEFLGYTNVTLTGDAKQTLALLEKPDIKLDLILMDIGLPDVTGIALAEKIRQSNLTSKNVPIVALTGNNENSTKEKCFAIGMNDFLTKPVSTADLQKMLETLFP